MKICRENLLNGTKKALYRMIEVCSIVDGNIKSP